MSPSLAGTVCFNKIQKAASRVPLSTTTLLLNPRSLEFDYNIAICLLTCYLTPDPSLPSAVNSPERFPCRPGCTVQV
jgi:hypothetical protein